MSLSPEQEALIADRLRVWEVHRAVCTSRGQEGLHTASRRNRSRKQDLEAHSLAWFRANSMDGRAARKCIDLPSTHSTPTRQDAVGHVLCPFRPLESERCADLHTSLLVPGRHIGCF